MSAFVVPPTASSVPTASTLIFAEFEPADRIVIGFPRSRSRPRNQILDGSRVQARPATANPRRWSRPKIERSNERLRRKRQTNPITKLDATSITPTVYTAIQTSFTPTNKPKSNPIALAGDGGARLRHLAPWQFGMRHQRRLRRAEHAKAHERSHRPFAINRRSEIVLTRFPPVVQSIETIV